MIGNVKVSLEEEDFLKMDTGFQCCQRPVGTKFLVGKSWCVTVVEEESGLVESES